MSGAIDVLGEPEQREQIRKMVAEMSREAARATVDTVASALAQSLGKNGEGPLAESLAGTSARMAATAVQAARAQLPEFLRACDGPDAATCIQRTLQSMARSTATGFTAGVRDTIGWPLIALAFLLGIAGGLLGSWVWSLRLRTHRFRHA